MTKLQITLEHSNRPSMTESAPKPPDGQSLRQESGRIPWYAGTLCRVGLHWGKWDYIAEENCSQLLICGRCAKNRLRTKHLREWHYTQEGSCEQVRTCSRCQAQSGVRTRHIWGQSYYSGNEGSHQCQRCGEVQSWSIANG